MTGREQKYHQAAVAYFVYGLVYLAGAVYVAETGVAGRSMSEGGGWMWFVMGALFVVLFPPLIWNGYKWVTRILAALLVVRMIGLGEVIVSDGRQAVALPGGIDLPLAYGAAAFWVVAAVTCFMLVRAGWNLGSKEQTPNDQSPHVSPT